MKKIFFILISFLLFTSNICNAKDIKFVQITDVNYGAEGSDKILQAAIQDINEMKDINFVIFT